MHVLCALVGHSITLVLKQRKRVDRSKRLIYHAEALEDIERLNE